MHVYGELNTTVSEASVGEMIAFCAQEMLDILQNISSNLHGNWPMVVNSHTLCVQAKQHMLAKTLRNKRRGNGD